MNATHTPADAPTIIEDVISFLNRYIAFPDERQAVACALWVIHTHAFEAAYTTPYLYVTSAEKQSGKTRVIEVLSLLAHNTLTTASASPGALYAAISTGERKPTIFIDEVDAIFTGAANEDLRGMLNSGYKKNGTVLRQQLVEGGERIAVPYSTFAPKLLAGIDNGAMPDTIADRCIRIVLKRKLAGQEVERFMERKAAPIAEELQTRIAEWAKDNLDALFESEPNVIDEISDRAFEIAEPLLAIADRIPGWHDKAREALTFLLRGEVKALSLNAQALKAAQEYMDTHRTDRITSAMLSEMVGVNAKRLGVLLAAYEIRPHTVRFNGTPAKGYLRADFEDAWSRYL